MRVPVDIGAVIERLQADAAKGNVQAARELRSYLAEVRTEEATEVSDLDKRTRQRVMAMCLAALEAEDRDGPLWWCWDGDRLIRAD